MRTIALISQKGGCGKTTVAIHLATSMQSLGVETIVLDLDPQTSAAEWKDARADERPYVMPIPPSRLSKTMEAAERNGAAIVVLDTAPHSEGAALEAARAADLILVPCHPSIMDLRAMRKTVDLLNYARKPTFALLNEVSPQGVVADEAAKAIASQFGLAVAPVRLTQRVAYNRCLLAGLAAQEFEPGGKAAQEVAALTEWVRAQMRIPAPTASRKAAPPRRVAA